MELVQEDLLRVEQEIDLESMASVNAVTTISRYLSRNGGKRLRPILALLAGVALAGETNAEVRSFRLQWEIAPLALGADAEMVQLGVECALGRK